MRTAIPFARKRYRSLPCRHSRPPPHARSAAAPRRRGSSRSVRRAAATSTSTAGWPGSTPFRQSRMTRRMARTVPLRAGTIRNLVERVGPIPPPGWAGGGAGPAPAWTSGRGGKLEAVPPVAPEARAALMRRNRCRSWHDETTPDAIFQLVPFDWAAAGADSRALTTTDSRSTGSSQDYSSPLLHSGPA